MLAQLLLEPGHISQCLNQQQNGYSKWIGSTESLQCCSVLKDTLQRDAAFFNQISPKVTAHLGSKRMTVALWIDCPVCLELWLHTPLSPRDNMGTAVSCFCFSVVYTTDHTRACHVFTDFFLLHVCCIWWGFRVWAWQRKLCWSKAWTTNTRVLGLRWGTLQEGWELNISSLPLFSKSYRAGGKVKKHWRESGGNRVCAARCIGRTWPLLSTYCKLRVITPTFDMVNCVYCVKS